MFIYPFRLNKLWKYQKKLMKANVLDAIVKFLALNMEDFIAMNVKGFGEVENLGELN